MTITIRSSSVGDLADPVLLRKELATGHAVELTDLGGAILARREDIIALADQLAISALSSFERYRLNAAFAVRRS